MQWKKNSQFKGYLGTTQVEIVPGMRKEITVPPNSSLATTHNLKYLASHLSVSPTKNTLIYFTLLCFNLLFSSYFLTLSQSINIRCFDLSIGNLLFLFKERERRYFPQSIAFMFPSRYSMTAFFLITFFLLLLSSEL